MSPLMWPVLLAAMTILLPGCGQKHETSSRAANASEPRTVQSHLLPALTDIHGIEQQPFDDPAAKAVVLVFTLQDCPIANSYVPTLNQLVDTYEPRGVRLLLVHVDPNIAAEEARKHAEEYQIKAPVVVDRVHAWVRRVGATKSPEAVVFSPTGEIRYIGRIDDKYVGLGKRRTHVTARDLQDAIEAVLAGRPVARPKTEAIGCFIPSLPLGE